MNMRIVPQLVVGIAAFALLFVVVGCGRQTEPAGVAPAPPAEYAPAETMERDVDQEMGYDVVPEPEMPREYEVDEIEVSPDAEAAAREMLEQAERSLEAAGEATEEYLEEAGEAVEEYWDDVDDVTEEMRQRTPGYVPGTEETDQDY